MMPVRRVAANQQANFFRQADDRCMQDDADLFRFHFLCRRNNPSAFVWSEVWSEEGKPVMSKTKLRSTAIDAAIGMAVQAAVGCFPSELCRLAADYLIQLPHGWTPIAEAVDVRTDATDGRRTAIACIEPEDRWYTVVSTQTLATGDRRWTVEFDIRTDRVYIGAI
jgi:hypothetical protein